MTTFPRSPRLLKGGLVLIDPVTAAVQRIIVLQYNPDTLSRTLQVQAVGESADRSEALRLKGPPVETIKLEAEIDVTDQLELPQEGQNRVATELGLHLQLAALETIIYPPVRQVLENHRLARAGTMEIAPMEAPLTLFVWGKTRILPVRVTDLSVTEEAFDPNLNPIRAKVSLGLRVLSVNDLGFSHKGGDLFMTYFQQKEQLAAKIAGGSFDTLGIEGIR
jgi:contractile injection system tube protein